MTTISTVPPLAPAAPVALTGSAYEIAWEDHDDGALPSILSLVATHRPLVSGADVDVLTRLADTRENLVLQVGDCVEGFDDASQTRTYAKAAFLGRLAKRLREGGRPVVTVGRLAGQFAKPRSAATEPTTHGEQLTYRGPLVHAWHDRRVNVHRIATAVLAASQVSRTLDDLADGQGAPARVWTSHEVLLTEYEHRWVRQDADGDFLASTHWPWIGNRTRAVDGPHVQLLSQVRNPVSVKVDATLDPDEALVLLDTLRSRHPHRHVTFISRFGADAIEALEPLARAVSRVPMPPRWLIDPLHGNTVATPAGKTRPVDAVVRECVDAVQVLRGVGAHPGGIHLEATDLRVLECIDDRSAVDDRSLRGLSLCDPRLNEDQAGRVVEAFREAVA